jgi:hypothetical protein
VATSGVSRLVLLRELLQPRPPQNRPRDAGEWRKLDWSVKAPILLLALLIGLFEHRLNWGRGAFSSGLAMTIPIIGYRDFWNQGQSWVTVMLLGVIQVPLVIALRPVMEQFGFPVMFAFAAVDCALIATAISWVCSRE